MTYSTLSLIWMIFVYVYMPIVIIAFIALIICVGKNIRKKCVFSPGAIFIKCIPALLFLILFSVPAFYVNNKYNRYDYCVTIVEANKITDRRDEFLNERCSFYDLDELIDVARRY